ncbi:AMP-activated serine/threonine-protein kinase regulatory subunit [Microbotryomycetes sp. JL201]|nr:AMP-activated serine/threonine-protein kinase regulatory subunit [Microbotryomycetes sp. JL201]
MSTPNQPSAMAQAAAAMSPQQPGHANAANAAAPNASKLPQHVKALEGIRQFLESKSCYDILPESFRLIVFDNKLSITRSLQALVTNGVVSAPLYDSTTQRFAGMFTLADVVHLIQYYYLTAHEYENVVAEVEAFQLESLRKIEQAIDVPPPPTISVHPDQPLADACAALVRTHARRLPLVDRDDQTKKETIVSVLTQYRVLKFIAINCQHDCARLDQSIGSLGVGSYCSWYQPSTGHSPPSTPTSDTRDPISAITQEDSQLSGPLSPMMGVRMKSLPLADEAPAAEMRHNHIPVHPPPPERHESDMTVTASSPPPTATAPEMTPMSSTGTVHPQGSATPLTSEAAQNGADHRREASSSSSQLPDTPTTTVPARQGAHSATTSATKSEFGVSSSDKYFPLSTASMQTSVFDVVHIFSERGISAVPIIDDDGVVLDMYETVDIVDLVRQNAYQVLDSTIEVALAQRSPDFTGVMTCTPRDTLSSILAYIRERRCHRFVIIEPEDVPANATTGTAARKKGSLVGILSLSDVLRYLVGHENLKGHEVPGLGVHGLRGVGSVGGTDLTTHSVLMASGALAGDLTDTESKAGSRRGSGATDNGSIISGASVQGLGLQDVIEGQAIE